jgi:hypothetical protein
MITKSSLPPSEKTIHVVPVNDFSNLAIWYCRIEVQLDEDGSYEQKRSILIAQDFQRFRTTSADFGDC